MMTSSQPRPPAAKLPARSHCPPVPAPSGPILTCETEVKTRQQSSVCSDALPSAVNTQTKGKQGQDQVDKKKAHL